jgi:Flp pilus assembly pilin Flp
VRLSLTLPREWTVMGASMMTEPAIRIATALQGFMERGRDEDGQTLAEYSLIITAISVAVVVLALVAFRGALAGAFNAATGCLDGAC